MSQDPDTVQRFELVSDYEPAGDQPEAIARLVEGLGDGLAHQTLLGVTGSGKTFTMAHVIERTQRPALILAPNKTLAAQLYGEFRSFFPDNAVEYFVSYYDYYQPEAYVPQSDTYIEKEATINDEIDRLRLSATRSLFERRDVVIVASVSCIYGLGSPEAYYGMLLFVRQGDTLDRRDLLARVADHLDQGLPVTRADTAGTLQVDGQTTRPDGTQERIIDRSGDHGRKTEGRLVEQHDRRSLCKSRRNHHQLPLAAA